MQNEVNLTLSARRHSYRRNTAKRKLDPHTLDQTEVRRGDPMIPRPKRTQTHTDVEVAMRGPRPNWGLQKTPGCIAKPTWLWRQQTASARWKCKRCTPVTTAHKTRKPPGRPQTLFKKSCKQVGWLSHRPVASHSAKEPRIASGQPAMREAPTIHCGGFPGQDTNHNSRLSAARSAGTAGRGGGGGVKSVGLHNKG